MGPNFVLGWNGALLSENIGNLRPPSLTASVPYTGCD